MAVESTLNKAVAGLTAAKSLTELLDAACAAADADEAAATATLPTSRLRSPTPVLLPRMLAVRFTGRCAMARAFGELATTVDVQLSVAYGYPVFTLNRAERVGMSAVVRTCVERVVRLADTTNRDDRPLLDPMSGAKCCARLRIVPPNDGMSRPAVNRGCLLTRG